VADSILPPEFNRQVRLTCTAKVGGERVSVQTYCLEAVYNEPDAKKAINTQVRRALMDKILEKWTPKITVER
jgi:hypothetical protein